MILTFTWTLLEPCDVYADPDAPSLHSIDPSEAHCSPELPPNRRVGFESINQQAGRWRLKGDSWWVGRYPKSVKIDCDGLRQCSSALRRDKLLQAVGFPRDQRLTPQALESAWGRLMSLSLFNAQSYIALSAQREEEPPSLMLCMSPTPRIKSLRVTYGEVSGQQRGSWWSGIRSGAQSFEFHELLEGEIYKRLNLRRGAALPSSAELRRRADDLTAYYRRLGHQDTVVNILPESREAHQVKVRVHITEGERRLLLSPLITILDERLSEEAKEEHKRTIECRVKPHQVEYYNREVINERVEELERWLRAQGWVTAHVHVKRPDIYQSNVQLKVEVRLGPKLQVNFINAQAISDSALQEVLTFSASGAVDEIELAASAEALLNLYRSEGYYYARVVQSVLTRRSPQLIQTTFVFDEGPQVYVSHVELKGTSSVKLKRLRSLMSTQGVVSRGVVNNFKLSSGVLQDTVMERDLQLILSYYRDLGYERVKIRCSKSRAEGGHIERDQRGQLGQRAIDGPQRDTPQPIREMLWSTDVKRHRCFSVIPDQSERSQRQLLTVRVEIQEGAKTSVDQIDFASAQVEMTPKALDNQRELLIRLGFLDNLGLPVKRAGLSQAKLELLRGFLLAELKRQGHLFAQVIAVCHRRDKESVFPCEVKDIYGEALTRVSFKVARNARMRFGHLVIRGNILTRESVIRREFQLSPGDPLDAEALFLSQKNLRSLNLFKSVKLTTISAPSSSLELDQMVSMLLDVEERLPWLLDGYVGLGVSNQQTYLTSPEFTPIYSTALAIRHRNVAGIGWEVGGGVTHDNALYQWREPQNERASWSASVFAKTPRFLGTYLQMTSELLWEQRLSNQRNLYIRRSTASMTLSYDFYQTSFPRLWGRGLRFDLQFEGSYEATRQLVDPDVVSSVDLSFSAANPSFVVSPSLIYDQRDNPVHPTRGFYVTLDLDLLGSRDLISGVISYRETLNAQWIGSLFKRNLLFIPTIKLGAIQSELDDAALGDTLSDFLFIAGGDQVTYPVRGYQVSAINTCQESSARVAECRSSGAETSGLIDPQSISGRAVFNFSVELRASSRVLPNLWFATFSDVGAVSRRLSDLSLNSLYPSVGVGARYLLYGQLPLRFDVSYPLKSTLIGTQELTYYFDFFYTF